jgi:hypothetical protein
VYDASGNLVAANQDFNPRYGTDQYLVKGDYVRLRSLRLDYNFGKTVTDQLRLKGLRVFVSADNLLTWTAEFEGYDPEGANVGGAQSRNLEQGSLGYGVLPAFKSYNFGIGVRF